MGRSIWRTRSLRKMKLPLSSPSTSSSPSGYASVIAPPSSATLRAIVSTSNTIDLTGRPPVRRRTSGVLSIDPHGLGPRRRKEGLGPADAGHPDQIVGPVEHGPVGSPAPRNAGVLEAPDQQPAAPAPQGTDALTR